MAAKVIKLQLCVWIKLLSIAVFLEYCSSTEAITLRTPASLTTEGIRFAESRCQYENRMASGELKTKWAQRIYPDDKLTHCYIKCFLSRLGLINLKEMGLDWNKLYIFWFNMDQNFDDKCLQIADIIEELDGTCYSYYKKWLSLWEKCETLMRYIVINKSQPSSKPFGMTALEYCDSLEKENNATSKVLSDSRHSTSFKDLYKCQLECLLRHYHYFDAYGRLDFPEILRSFTEAHQSTPKNIAAARICTHRANSLFSYGYCEMAFELKECLTKHSVDFSNICQVRDKLTRYY